ncbi:GTPase HflX [Aureibacter tunicatorum]|uniref:GTPase HflX n=1 Tax=Aureibacter tunicatorum TaxID=866807 RepID=A0AAE3XLC7_9BACT|nr:GTPase HflX [Aureibacter tunicatorum]MDR6238133.1 GTP-binding protein HflX [Aureibacter tunicatorum]BDD03166.1 GTPase HflX [Aureibacter tunicatorum]
MAKTYDTGLKKETAVLVAVAKPDQANHRTIEYLDELAFLAETKGIETIKTFTQKLDKPDKKTFIGKGKLEEVDAYAKNFEVDYVIFDDDLTPSQLRNLEKILKRKIYDRSLLILDIFLIRAQTAQAKVQVELARLQYLLPRLTRMWTHLERQRGGTSTRGGAGEKEIETDKRAIRNQITILKERLAKIDKQSMTQRKNRSRQVRCALVGYTNVGKSTIMRAITKSNVFAENKLFATVDSTVRKVVFNSIPFLLTDTVGFIRKLPHSLIECFKSTLDEVREADVLIHVVDISHEAFEDHIDVVNTTLAELKVVDKPTILVFNKIDLYEQQLKDEEAREDSDNPEFMTAEEKEKALIDRLKSTYHGKKDYTTVFIAAKDKTNFEELRKEIYLKVKEKYFTIFPNYVNPMIDYENFTGEELSE